MAISDINVTIQTDGKASMEGPCDRIAKAQAYLNCKLPFRKLTDSIGVGRRGPDLHVGWSAGGWLGKWKCDRWSYFGFGLWFRSNRPVRFRWRFDKTSALIGVRVGHRFEILAFVFEVHVPFVRFAISIQDAE